MQRTNIDTNNKVKKIIVEMEDGQKLEFEKQFVLFVEDEATDTQAKLAGADAMAIGMMGGTPCFLATTMQAGLEVLRDRAPGLDLGVIMKHIGLDSEMGMLGKILGI